MPELKARLHWLMGLRVVVVTLMLGLSLAFPATRGEFAITFSALIIFTYLHHDRVCAAVALLGSSARLDGIHVGAGGDGFPFGNHSRRADRRHRKSLRSALCDHGYGRQSRSSPPGRIGDGSRLHDVVRLGYDRFNMSVFLPSSAWLAPSKLAGPETVADIRGVRPGIFGRGIV